MDGNEWDISNQITCMSIAGCIVQDRNNDLKK